MAVEGYIQLTGLIRRADGTEAGFIGFCTELKLDSQGKTIDEAIANLRETLVTCLTFLNGEDELVDVLHWRGIPLLDHAPAGDRSVTVAPGTVVCPMVAWLDHNRVTFVT